MCARTRTCTHAHAHTHPSHCCPRFPFQLKLFIDGFLPSVHRTFLSFSLTFSMGKSTSFCPSSSIFFLLWSPALSMPPPGCPPYFRSLSSAGLLFVLTYFKVCSQHRNPTFLKFQDASCLSPHPQAPPCCKTKAVTPSVLLVISILTADSRASWASTAPVPGASWNSRKPLSYPTPWTHRFSFHQT